MLEIVRILHHKMKIEYHSEVYPIEAVQEALEKEKKSFEAFPFGGHQNDDLVVAAPG